MVRRMNEKHPFGVLCVKKIECYSIYHKARGVIYFFAGSIYTSRDQDYSAADLVLVNIRLASFVVKRAVPPILRNFGEKYFLSPTIEDAQLIKFDAAMTGRKTSFFFTVRNFEVVSMQAID
jgi:hypothetical protein